MCETAEGLTFRTLTVGKDFGNENPDDRALSNSVRSDKGEDANRHDGVMLREEGPSHQTERGDVAERADIEQGAAAEPVDEPEANECEDQIGDADAKGTSSQAA